MITSIAGAESCAASLAGALGVPVEIASSRKLGLSALRRRDYATVIVDESIAEADPAGADLIWKHSGLAVPLQINFALVGCARLGREVKAALARREQEQSLAMRAATSSLENDLKSTVTGLLLQSELALSEPSVPPQLASKLQLMVELAGTLRRRLSSPASVVLRCEPRPAGGAASVVSVYRLVRLQRGAAARRSTFLPDAGRCSQCVMKEVVTLGLLRSQG